MWASDITFHTAPGSLGVYPLIKGGALRRVNLLIIHWGRLRLVSTDVSFDLFESFKLNILNVCFPAKAVIQQETLNWNYRPLTDVQITINLS